LPANFDGPAAPPSGESETFAGVDTSGAATGSSLQLWHLAPNWSSPTASTFGAAGNVPDAVVPVPTYNFDLCNYSSCVVQPGTSQRLDTLSDRLMNRLQYRNFGDHESLVVNHTVNAGNNVAGIRWYEVHNPAAPTLFQSGTYAPDSGTASPTSRWMASAALDSAGNMALGYSASSSSVYPSIRYTGRRPGDTPGTMTQPET